MAVRRAAAIAIVGGMDSEGHPLPGSRSDQQPALERRMRSALSRGGRPADLSRTAAARGASRVTTGEQFESGGQPMEAGSEQRLASAESECQTVVGIQHG